MSRKWNRKQHVEANRGGLERFTSCQVDTGVRECRSGVRRGGGKPDLGNTLHLIWTGSCQIFFFQVCIKTQEPSHDCEWLPGILNMCPKIKHVNKAPHTSPDSCRKGKKIHEQPCEDYLLILLQGAMPRGPVGSSRPKSTESCATLRFCPWSSSRDSNTNHISLHFSQGRRRWGGDPIFRFTCMFAAFFQRWTALLKHW